MTDRQGIEIDYCPKCRGVWLDRGELDKLIERSAAAPAVYEEAPRDERRYVDDDDRRRDNDDDRRRYESEGRPPYKKKKRSMFEDLFDFG